MKAVLTVVLLAALAGCAVYPVAPAPRYYPAYAYPRPYYYGYYGYYGAPGYYAPYYRYR